MKTKSTKLARQAWHMKFGWVLTLLLILSVLLASNINAAEPDVEKLLNVNYFDRLATIRLAGSWG